MSDRAKAAPEDPVDGPALNVGTGRATTILELVRTLGEQVGAKLEVKHAAPRAGELFHSTLECSKIARRLRWSATTPLAQGLEETYRYFAALRGAST